MKCTVIIGDKLNILSDRQYETDIPEVSLLIIKDCANICSDAEYKEHWDKILEILTDEGIWYENPSGYIKSISVAGVKIYEKYTKGGKIS